MRLVKALVVALLLGLCGNSASASELEHEGTNSGGFQEEGGLEEIEEIIGEDEEEEFTREDVTCGFMMMGMFFFIMVIFYFVNYPDDDIKRYSWSNISTTISIFCAILIFSAADEVILVFVISPVLGEFPKGWRQVARVAAGYVIFIAWLAVAEVMIAYFAKAFCASSRPDGRMAWVVHDSIRGDHGVPLQDLDSRATATVLPGTREKSIAKIGQLEVFVTMEDLEKEAAQRRTKSWSMLYAHMAGFAMISAGGDLQHSDFFRDDWPNSLLAVLLNVLFLLLVFWVSARLRPRGDESDMESDDEGPVEMWNENAIESEDELFCLSISFLLVQALRFQASGVLSTKAGLEPGENFGTMAILTVYGEALLFVVATVVVVFSGRTGRLADLLRGTLSMAFAWCLLFASRWMFESWPLLVKLNCPPKSIPGRLILSLFLSSFAFAVIIVLDQIEDAASNEDRRVTHKIVKNVVTGLSILVGFTWETTMDGCAEAVFSTIHENERARLVSKFMGVVVILLIVLPAWRRYVLHTVFRLLKHQRDQRAAQKLADKLQRLDPKLQEDGLLDMSDSEESAPDPELTC